MQKLLLLSLLFASVMIPMSTATMRSPTRAFRRMLFLMAVFNVLYVFAIVYVWPRLPS
jgi:hypothetical protein